MQLELQAEVIDEAAKRVPVVRAGYALQSFRDSGFTLAEALGEVIDNSLEADANQIRVQMDEDAHEGRRKHIHRIVVCDDGTGMDTDTLHQYLQLGFSTRYMRTDTIGKYGVGAKLAALCYAKRIDVWSRIADGATWKHVYLDLKEAFDKDRRGEDVYIEPPSPEPVPDDLLALMPAGPGTVVVWSHIDRLEEGRRAPDAKALRAELGKELSRIYRYFLHGGRQIMVNGQRLLPHDPLFLMDGTWADQVLSDYYARMDKAVGDDEQRTTSGESHFEAEVIAQEPIPIGDSHAILTVTLYPSEVTRLRLRGGDELAHKLRVPENEGAISFVRLNREINYTNVPRILPLGVQERDRFIGVEVAFSPELDAYFGVRNVKRGVEPHNELRTKIRARLGEHIPRAREILKNLWNKLDEESLPRQNEHTPVMNAVKQADRTLPKGRAKGPETEDERQQVLDDLVMDVVGEDPAAKADYLESIKGLPFVVESVEWPGYGFMDVQHLDGQVIIRINTRHRFYREIWRPLRTIAEQGHVSSEEAVRASRRAIQALTLLLIAYGKAESMDADPKERYGDLLGYWGQFMHTLMSRVPETP